MRPIDADELIDEFKRISRICASNHDTDGAFIADLCTHKVECVAPTLDVLPVVHGHWIRKWDTHCSACGVGFSEMPYSYDTKDGPGYVETFCPNCGAIMDEKEEEEYGRNNYESI